MKTLFQILLFTILIFFCLIIYNKYFNIKKNSNLKIYEDSSVKNSIKSGNNSIKDLLYNVKIQGDKEYIIKAKSGEISYINNSEIVLMKDVIAKIIFKNQTLMIIVSDEANYNALNYNTIFEKNVRVDYLNHIIKSNIIHLDNINDVIEIKDNVIYEGNYGKVFSENLSIDLLTKNINIYTKTPSKKVHVKLNPEYSE